MSKAQYNSRQDKPPEWLDLRAVTGYACVSKRTIREWIHRLSDPLPAVRVGTKILIRRSAFDRWLESHPLIPTEPVNLDETVNEIIAGLTD